MEIKYDSSNQLVIRILGNDYSFEKEYKDIIKVITSPIEVLPSKVTISRDIINEPDITIAKNYSQFISSYMETRKTVPSEKKELIEEIEGTQK